MPGPILCASPGGEDPLSRSYRVNLPSSLTVIHSSALVYSTRPRVSVCGTGAAWLELSGFSRESDYARYCRRPKALAYSQGRLKPRICLGPSTPTPFNGLFRQPAALSLFRLHVAPCGSTGILTGSAIGLACRLSLRTRLTLIRLALIRKPWSYGGQVSRLPYRYLYLHLPHAVPSTQLECSPTDDYVIPRLRQHAYARLLSMPDPSTSELLRTL